MKKRVAAAIVLLLLAGFAIVTYRMSWVARILPGAVPGAAASGSAGGQPPAQAAGQAPAAVPAADAASDTANTAADAATGLPPFDGNIAAHEWGGKMESVTGVPGDDDMEMSRVLRGWEISTAAQGPTEFVISFFGREPVLIDRLELIATEQATPLDRVEISASMSAPTAGFNRVAAATLSGEKTNTLRFDPVEARFVKVRLEGERFSINWIKVFEAERPGYVPLLSRRRDVRGPLATGGAAPASAGAMRPCEPGPPTAPAPGHGQSRKVLVVSDLWTGPGSSNSIPPLRMKNEDRKERLERLAQWAAEIAVVDQMRFDVVVTQMARPWHLSEALGYDTVMIEQVNDVTQPLEPSFKKALPAWVAAGHKLIIQDADKTAPPSYDYLPYRFKTSSPGAVGAPGEYLRILEDNWMVHNRRGVPGFLDVAAWEGSQPPYINELGDTNTIYEWDGHWCGHIAVRNVKNVFGFGAAYAHYGRGLILYNGFDIDMSGTPGYEILVARELAQGFDPDNLPCSARMGHFVVTTDARLLYRPLVPGKSLGYPLTLLSNQAWKGEVTLTATTFPAVEGFRAQFDSPKVAVTDLHKVGLTLTLPASTPPKAVAVEVKGTSADGKTNTLCLELGPPRGGELQVVSALRPPTRTGKNLEIILDASGSMKTPLVGKKTRWDVALDTLQQVLAQLPDDFNVGLRMYGHREGSRSPKTCTDSELLAPIASLDRQALLARAKAFRPKGETPLVYSALQAPTDLKAVGGGTVILITDGEESCKGDPVKAAADLKASGLDLRLNIVGFALKNPKVQKDLSGFAQSTGGLFYAADSGAALGDALMLAAVEKFPYTVYDAAGKVVLTGEAGAGADPLAAGDYKVVVKAGTKELVAPKVSVGLGQSVALAIAMKNGQLVLQ